MDLKALLLEAKQKVPPVLQVLHCGDESMLDIGGDFRRGNGPGGWGEHNGSTTKHVQVAYQRAWGRDLMGSQGLGCGAWSCKHADSHPRVPRRTWLCLLWGPGPSNH